MSTALAVRRIAKHDALINPKYQSDLYCKYFQMTLNGETSESKPFPHFFLPDFIESQEFVEKIRAELLCLLYNSVSTDLYCNHQTFDIEDCAPSYLPSLMKFRDFLKIRVHEWLSSISGINLSNRVSIISTIYSQTDFLLPHDDLLDDRIFAYVYYLTPMWKSGYGGELTLFDSVDNVPQNEVETIEPLCNSLALFRVSPASWHMVKEVEKSSMHRLSVHGWFHTKEVMNVVKLPPPVSRYTPFNELPFEKILEFINRDYFVPAIIDTMSDYLMRNNYVVIPDFLNRDVYQEIIAEAKNSSYKIEYLPDKRRAGKLISLGVTDKATNENSDEVQENEIHGVINQLCMIFRSKEMALFLSKFINFNAKPNGASYRKGFKNNRNFLKFQSHNVSFLRYGKTCYQLIDHQLRVDKSELAVDVHYFIVDGEWQKEFGGSITEHIDGPRQFFPQSNMALISLRQPEKYFHVNYLNSKTNEHVFYLLTGSFHGIMARN